MSDRVPIAAIAGTVDPHAGTDFAVLPVGFTGSAARLFVGVTDPPSGGSVALSFRNATAGGGDGIDATIADGVSAITATGTVTFTGTETGYLRVVSATGSAMNLYGWIEVNPILGAAATAFLTTLARVKDWLQITDAANDAALNTLVAGVSKRIQTRLRRPIVLRTLTAEALDGRATDILQTREWPIVEPPAVVLSLNGTVVAASEYQVDAANGHLVNVQNGINAAWARGRRNYLVTYNAGFATVPEDLQLAATMQTAYLWQKQGARIGSRGSILDATGSAQYLTGPWAPGVLDTLAPYRDRRLI